LTTIAIIGAGPLGRWLALAAARAGYRVFLEDVMPSNLHHAQEYLRRQLSPPPAEGAGDEALVSHAIQRGELNRGTHSNPVASTSASAPQEQPAVCFVSTVEDAVREADLVIDCVPDELESKLEILWLLDRMAPPKTVIATPTTNLSLADLASCTYRPEKCIAIAADPRALSGQTPGSAIRLITIPRTAPDAAACVESFWRRLGFIPTLEQASD
jgi:3-hydroxybutyryl-CoA dehydrogenase